MLGNIPSGDDLELIATCLEHYGWAEYTALLVDDKTVEYDDTSAPTGFEPDLTAQERLSA